jgi:hypothetical protein
MTVADDERSDRNDDERSPVDHLLDYCVFAPLGFALEAHRLVPDLIDRGRAQAGVARMVGEFAVKWGSTRVESAVVDVQEQAMDLLRRSGLAPVDDRRRDDAPPKPAPEPSTATGPERTTDDPTGATATSADTTSGAPAAGHADTVPVPTTPGSADGDGTAAGDPAVDVATLAIPDYDNLSASQVVPRLDGLTADELEAVRRYERTNRGRKTILNKVHQLQHPEG